MQEPRLWEEDNGVFDMIHAVNYIAFRFLFPKGERLQQLFSNHSKFR